MDHNRINLRVSNISCGVMEISGITDPEGALYQIAGRLYHPSRGEPVAFLVGSDVKIFGGTNSDKLCRLFEKLNLGEIQYSVLSENPKTGNIIFIYTININHQNFKKWYAEQRVKKLKTVGT